MKQLFLIVAPFLVASCGPHRGEGREIADLQAKSLLGATAAWKLDPALPSTKVQEMRDRAYRYCLIEKASNQRCFAEQDHSLFEYANSFRVVRIFRSEDKPTFPFAVAHKRDPAAFRRAESYCRSVYEDQGSRDVRGLGPCMSAVVGADFFGVVPVS
jgi:hypothetical protein